MRMMLRFTVPVEKGNAALKDGSLGKAMELIMGQLKPEAAYFGVSDGLRSGMIFFDMTEASQVVTRLQPMGCNSCRGLRKPITRRVRSG